MTDYVGQTIEGKYRIDQLLGEGGMGVVYAGQHVLIGRRVAVKLLHRALLESEEAVKRFFREGQAAAAIGHRNVIDVLDVGVTPEGDPFLVMEFLEGENLADLLAREGPVGLETACAVLEPALRALEAAHAQGVVHRDLKPENIFLERRVGEEPEVKLIDFGISKFAPGPDGTKLTQDGSMLGTPAYMSPEQVRGSGGVDARSDLYAVGVILYEMLTGATPFPGEHYNEVLANVLTSEPVPPQQHNPEFPEQAGPLVERALKRDPAERFASAEEMLEEVRSLTTRDERLSGLTMLGQELQVGNLSTPARAPTEGRSATGMAAELLGQVAGETAADASGPGWRSPRDWPALARQVWGDRRQRLLAGAGLGGALLVLALLAGLCSGAGDGVEIEVVGAPAGAKIYWDDSLVPLNPFRVEQGDTLVPLRVEAPGHAPFKMSLVPDEDQQVEVALEPRKGGGRARKKAERKQAASAPREDGAPQPKAAPEKAAEPERKPAKKKAAKKKKPAEPAEQGADETDSKPGKKKKSLRDAFREIKPPWRQ